MKKIGFIGAFDKTNFIMYTAKLLQLLNYKVLVIDSSSIQKMRYIIPTVNPTKSYVTDFENMDFAIGFDNWQNVINYLGIEDEIELYKEGQDVKGLYDYVLIDIDSSECFKGFELEEAYKNYFVTSFDSFNLKKGMCILENLPSTISMTKILFSFELRREDEEYLNNLIIGYDVDWNKYTMYFHIQGDDNKVFEENQRLERIKFRRLSTEYKESLSYVIEDITKDENKAKLKRIMKD